MQQLLKRDVNHSSLARTKPIISATPIEGTPDDIPRLAGGPEWLSEGIKAGAHEIVVARGVEPERVRSCSVMGTTVSARSTPGPSHCRGGVTGE
eukprot:14718780-Heterocapsa_arctica.AAC.1